MAVATFHSLRGEKSALLLVKANAFQYTSSCAYVPRDAVAGKEPGEKITIPDNYRLVPMVDSEGNIRTTTDGEPLHTLAWG